MQSERLSIVYAGGNPQEAADVERILSARGGETEFRWIEDPARLADACAEHKPDLLIFRIQDVMVYDQTAALHWALKEKHLALIVLGDKVDIGEMARLLRGGAQRYLAAAWLKQQLLEVVDALLLKRNRENEDLGQEANLAFAPLIQAQSERIPFKSDIAGMAISDLESARFLDLNNAMADMLGLKREEALGKTIQELGLLPQGQPDLVGDLVEILKRQGRIAQFEQPYLRQGEVRWGLISLEAVEIDGRMCTITVMVDITEQKRLQDELRQANLALEQRVEERTQAAKAANLDLVREVQEKYQLEESRDQLVEILWEMPLIVAVGFPGRPLAYLNRAGRELLGVALDGDLPKLDFFAIFAPAQRELISGLALPHAMSHGTWKGEVECINHRGEIFPVAHSIIALRNAKNQVVAFTSISRDISDSKRYEEELKKSREQYRILAESAKDLIFLTDAHGCLIYVNDYACQMFQAEIDALIGRRLTSVLEQAGLDVRDTDLERFMDSRVPLYVELQATLQGKRVWLSTRLVPIFDSQDRLQNVLGISRDITARKGIEDELRNTKEQMERLLAVSPMVMYKIGVDEPHAMTYLSENVIRVFGYSASQILENQDLWMKLTHPDDVSIMLTMREILENGTWQGEYRILDAAGNLHWIREVATLKRNAQGMPEEIYGFLQDITQQREEREALRKSEERYRSLAEAAHDFIYVISRDFTIEYVNSYGARVFGLTPDDIIGRSHSEVFGGAQGDRMRRSLTGVFERGQPLYFETEVQFPSGSIWLGTSLVPIVHEGEAVVSVLGLSRDITGVKNFEFELKKSLDQEQELNALKSQFIATTSHEFRTPLSTILSSAELLEFYGERWTEDRRKMHLQRIKGAAKRMNDLLTDILSLERFEAHKAVYEPSAVEIVALCREIMDETRLHDHDQHVYIFEPAEETITIITDERILRMIVENLLSNAVKYSSPDRRVDVKLSRTSDQAVIEVQDQGMGIPAKDQEHLFETFFRGTNVGAVQGSGLGLPIVREALDVVGGKIEIQSSEGLGTKVRITLPVRPLEA